MQRQARFLQPLDVLFLRGNKPYGDPGSYGESMLPPWPSVAAGALRSRMLIDAGIDPAAFGRGECTHPALGSVSAPEGMALGALHLARRCRADAIETVHPLPADLVVCESASGGWVVRRVHPHDASATGLASSAASAYWPVLADPARSKPLAGVWLSAGGWARYLAGELPGADTLLGSGAIWRVEERIGVGLDPQRRAAADGQLFSAQAIALQPDVGFLLTVRAPAGTVIPEGGLLRFGGDGRAVAISPAPLPDAGPDPEALAREGRFRLVLTSPGLFPDGDRLPGMQASGTWSFRGLRARVVCAVMGRAATVSGWDLARQRPKTAQRVVPPGAVYWVEADAADPAVLHKFVSDGLWSDPCEDPARRVEGFNQVALARW
jgi:CRISPR-associated protein Cmr3